ncbi:MAG: hypothetical protein A2857_04720 [Candidatus Levybacteria bacterium RIFCSPHIGHO2_01_FULL_36_15]|nr:MAG: hypothetical protein A2857_04720 [Candidatus Levybacteria bacterium RIFCSPHIGHO2_01_FULL_36_15]OGH39030.1 MAG: hypothetical protein A2905_04665 [Candidatus Levybacteria bacterium RIFCSPLOWO2_01_FULL_36_10]
MDGAVITKNIPTVFIIFGATGDLMSKKIVPAFFHLYKKNKLPKLFKIIGFSRRNLTVDQFRGFVMTLLENQIAHKDKDLFKKFLSLFLYQQGGFDRIKSYNQLAQVLGKTDKDWSVCSNKLFYLAVPPHFNKTIFEHLKTSGLTIPCGPEEGWTRVIVEKPFGKDLKTAEELDTLLGKLFKEEQIYRIDHYLAKEMMQNILSFRFANNLFEEVWNNNFIERIDIRLLESIGVEKRGAFYDGIGALRDVGQNHLLQMLALITMDQPENFESNAVRKKRAEILKTLRILPEDEIKHHTFRAQYKGYRQITGVNPDSSTETYFKTVAYLTFSRWIGVPVFLESGKRLPRKKEIVVTFKHPIPCLCPPNVPEHYQNKIIFSLEPREEIKIQFWSKKPGLEFEMEKRTLNFLFRREKQKTQYVEEYEKLLLDCIAGNQLLFISTDEVKPSWKYIDPIVTAWRKNLVPLEIYKPDSKKILVKSLRIENRKTEETIKKEIGIIGLGKMGGNIARRLIEKNWRVVGYNRTPDDTKILEREGMTGAYSLKELLEKLSKPRIILLNLPAGKALDDIIFPKNGLLEFLDKGDFIIEGGNSYYKDSIRRYNLLQKKGIRFVDAGISGGPGGARNGACIMVGGDEKDYNSLFPLFLDMATEKGVMFFKGAGAGHFVKMVHNGIEYGMMQAIAEGFTVLQKSEYKLDLAKVAKIYNQGSVIESRLIGWLEDAFKVYSEDLKEVSGSVGYTGEGEWTVKTAHELKIDVPAIEDAVKFRIESFKSPTYMGKIISAIRNRFGGHSIKK